MIILGIDPGLANTGFGVISVENRKMRAISYGVIKTKAGLPHGERLSLIFDKLEEVVKQFAPQAAAVESLYFAKNVKTAMPVSEAKGVVLLSLHRNGVSTFEYTPLQIKQGVVGAGRAAKEQVQHMVQLLLGLQKAPKPDHAADALAAAICHYNTTGGIHV